VSCLLQIRTRRIVRSRFRLAQKSGGRPRLSVFRSGRHIYAQVVDGGRTLASASSLEKPVRETNNKGCSLAHQVGTLVAERALAAKVSDVVFDRGGFPYHGRVKAVAEGARAGGLSF
jgi:large subunit ribosomal protein L18